MARSIWKGSISFGLVNIPVGLYTAEEREEIPLHLLDKRNMARVRYKRVNEESGKEVPWEDTVRGYEFQEGKYVILTDEDLKRAAPEKTQTVDIQEFVDLDEISPVYFDKPYYLAPEKRGAKSYALLREVLKRTRKVGVATVVIRTKQYLAALIAEDKVLLLALLRFPHELRDPNDLELPSGQQGLTERELDMAERLVEGMVDTWRPERFKDTYFSDVKKMIAKRVEAGQLESAPPPAEEEAKPARSNVVDLMALLKQSVERGGRAPAKKAPAKKTKAATKKAAAKKTPAKKTAAKKRKSA
jgi:DNA end-binding protein Ku